MPHFHLHRACFLFIGNYCNSFYNKKISKVILEAMTNYKNAGTNKTSTRSISTSTASKVNEVFRLFDKLFEKYLPDEVFVSFNGGKDCTVVLDLLSQYYKRQLNLNHSTISVMYIRPKSPFREVEEFVAQCKESYNLNVIVREGHIKPTLASICADNPRLRVVVMGVRRTDPSGRDLQIMQQTDPGWPQLLRVNPILDWSWRDIWSYMLENNVAYCPLYDKGYTSLGDSTNTIPNVNLRRECPLTGKVTYLPAYELQDETLERDGR